MMGVLGLMKVYWSFGGGMKNLISAITALMYYSGRSRLKKAVEAQS